MTATTPRTAAPHATPQPAAMTTVAGWLLTRNLIILAWFAGIAVATIFLIALPVFQRFLSEVDSSLWEAFATTGPAWFVLGLGAMAGQYLPVLVAQGVTRRRFVLAAGLALAATALVVGVLIAAGYLAEAQLFRRFDLAHTLRGEHLFGSISQYPLVVLESAVRSLHFGLVGLLIGLAYYRYGTWLGTALLPLTAFLPISIGLALLSLDPAAVATSWQNLRGASGVGPLLLLGFELLLFVVCAWFASSLPLRTKSS